MYTNVPRFQDNFINPFRDIIFVGYAIFIYPLAHAINTNRYNFSNILLARTDFSAKSCQADSRR